MKSSCLSVLLVYATQRTANCVALAILIGTYQLVNDIPYVPTEVMPASVCTALHSRAPGQSSTSGTECLTVLVGSRYKRLSQLALDLMASPASQAYVERLFSLCGDLTARKQNTKVSVSRRVFLKLKRHILHWTQCTVNWSVTCFWYCRTLYVAETAFLNFTDLLSVVISRTTLTYKNVKTKTKMSA